MSRLLPSLLACFALVASLTLTSCSKSSTQQASAHHALNFESFVPIYNQYIHQWLLNQKKTTEADIARLTKELESTSAERKPILESSLKDQQRALEAYQFRLSLGDFLKFSDPSQIPTNLTWKNGLDEPEFGDPAATKGGSFRKFIGTFPPTLRPFGNQSNNSFRGELYDYIDIPLVTLHPTTMQVIPGVAKEWATSPDGRTVYFRLHEDATYSNGSPIHAKDYLFAIYLQVSDHIVNPYTKQFCREERAQFTVFDDHTLAVTLPQAQVYSEAMAGAAIPSCPEFYKDYGPDYELRYQWLFPPTTGAYEVHPEDVIKGNSITQTRVKNWWANNKKFYRYRFNPDTVVQTVIRDESKAFELFRAGQIESFYVSRPELWYDKCEMDPIYHGYINRYTFYKNYPKSPFGLYVNVTKKPLNDRNVRIGIQHALNWQKVMDVLFRGDCQRLNAFNEGYTLFSDPSIRARPFSINLAREAFYAAGFTKEGNDGILSDANGNRLSITLSYANQPSLERVFTILREDAKACGLDLRLDGLEETVAYKKEMEKQHELSFGAWSITPPIPEFKQFFHSSNAFNENGTLRTQTNNTFCWGRPDTDALCEQVRYARNPEELKTAAWKLQNIIHDEAIFIPGYSMDYIRIASWRWVCWPNCSNTQFSPPVVYDPHELNLFWIDTKKQQETLNAMRNHSHFPESNTVFDQFRQSITPNPAETSEP